MKYYHTTTTYNCGIDLHARSMYVCVMDKEGKILLHRNVKKNDFEYFLVLVAPYRHDLTVTCESTYNWYWLSDACEDAGIEFVLAHALYLSSVHGGKHKNDREDCKELADCLRTNRIPPGYVYPREKRALRRLLRRRMKYVWQRAGLILHVGGMGAAEGCEPVKCSQRSRSRWNDAVLEQHDDALNKLCVESDMSLIQHYDHIISRVEWQLESHTRATQCADFVSLKSINGVGTVLALTILHETDTWERFPTVQDYISYCRLIPGTSSSAGKLLGFKGGKLGNPYLKWAYKEAAMLCKRNHPDLRAYGQRLENKHGTKKANAILASKLARSVYHMLQDHSVFDPKKFVGKN